MCKCTISNVYLCAILTLGERECWGIGYYFGSVFKAFSLLQLKTLHMLLLSGVLIALPFLKFRCSFVWVTWESTLCPYIPQMFGISPLSLSTICDARMFGGDQYIISMSLTYCNVLDVPTRLQNCISFYTLFYFY